VWLSSWRIVSSCVFVQHTDRQQRGTSLQNGLLYLPACLRYSPQMRMVGGSGCQLTDGGRRIGLDGHRVFRQGAEPVAVLRFTD
jgi:hypothetical protein